MSAFPSDLLDRPRPRAPHERLRSRRTTWAVVLGPLALASTCAAAALLLRLEGPRGLVLRLGLGLGAVVLLQVIARRTQRRGAWPVALEEAAALYRSGDLAAAQAKLSGLLEGPLHPAYGCIALSWTAMIALRRGAPGRALELFAEVARSGHLRERGLRLAVAGVPGLIALAAAIEGPDDRAARWLEQLRFDHGLHGQGTRTLAMVYAALRRGERERGRELAHAGWAAAEGGLAPAELRALRLLLAFSEPEQDSATAWRLREGARPAWPGELDFLGQGFPAFAAYLAAHGFSGPGHG